MDFRPTSQTAFSSIDPSRASALEDQFSRKRGIAAVVVPTDDLRVRERHRELGQPVTLFGEGPAERRDRLREYIYNLQTSSSVDADGDTTLFDAAANITTQDDEQEEFYTEGTPALLAARRDIAVTSIRRAARRVAYLRKEAQAPLRAHVRHRAAVKERLRGFELYGSDAQERPVGCTRFAPDGRTVAAGTWTGAVKILEVPTLQAVRTYKGHTDRVGGVAWRPGATTRLDGKEVSLASGGGEGHVQLWSLTDSTAPRGTLAGHSGRVCRVEFHPSGAYLASASDDTTWRLWDVATTQELLLAEGHASEVRAVAFNGDGALLASVGRDSYGRVWDLRTGRTIMILEGHTKDIFAVDWAPDGHRLLTGSADGFAICWDVRMVRETARVPAHSKGVTDLRWYKGVDGPGGESELALNETGADMELRKSGTFIISSGLDYKVNIFSANDWAPCRTLSGHAGNVLSCDISDDARWIVSGGYDRTVKLWSREDGQGI